MKVESSYGNQRVTFDLDKKNHLISSDGASAETYRFEYLPDGRCLIRMGTRSYQISDVSIQGNEVRFFTAGRYFNVQVKDEQALLLEKMGYKSAASASAGLLNAPMPGKILTLLVKEGDTIEAGKPVIILEAMKMENELKAPQSGTVLSVKVQAGQSVEKNVTLLEIG